MDADTLLEGCMQAANASGPAYLGAPLLERPHLSARPFLGPFTPAEFGAVLELAATA